MTGTMLAARELTGMAWFRIAQKGRKATGLRVEAHRVVCREAGGLVGGEVCQIDPAP